jgi:hypothetical protein
MTKNSELIDRVEQFLRDPEAYSPPRRENDDLAPMVGLIVSAAIGLSLWAILVVIAWQEAAQALMTLNHLSLS